MPNSNGKYNIKAVSNILGIQPSTLRAWKRRYHIIAPKKNRVGIVHIQKSIFIF